jgi:hypothetical protein
VRVFGNVDLKPKICVCLLLYGFGNRVRTKGYTILIHGLIHILFYIRITIIYYTIIIMTHIFRGQFLKDAISVLKLPAFSYERMIDKNKIKRKSTDKRYVLDRLRVVAIRFSRPR